MILPRFSSNHVFGVMHEFLFFYDTGEITSERYNGTTTEVSPTPIPAITRYMQNVRRFVANKDNVPPINATIDAILQEIIKINMNTSISSYYHGPASAVSRSYVPSSQTK